MNWSIEDIISLFFSKRNLLWENFAGHTLPFKIKEVVDKIFDLKLEHKFVDNNHTFAEGIYLNQDTQFYVVFFRERGVVHEQYKFSELREAVYFKTISILRGNGIKFEE